jgi:hypothetical protein
VRYDVDSLHIEVELVVCISFIRDIGIDYDRLVYLWGQPYIQKYVH